MATNPQYSSSISAPTARVTKLSQESARTLLQMVAASSEEESLALRVGQSAEFIAVPTAALKLLADILAEMGKGNAVSVIPADAELSAEDAAAILNMPASYFDRQLESGAIPFRLAGNQRRVLLADLLAYQRRVRELRLQALEELTEQAQELNMGY